MHMPPSPCVGVLCACPSKLLVRDGSQMTSAKRGEGVSQKLTKADKEGILSKADVSHLSNSYGQNYDICPLGALLFSKVIFFSNFLLSY